MGSMCINVLHVWKKTCTNVFHSRMMGGRCIPFMKQAQNDLGSINVSRETQKHKTYDVNNIIRGKLFVIICYDIVTQY